MRNISGNAGAEAGTIGKKWNTATEAEKSRIVTSIINKEITLRGAAIKYHISRRTITNWVNESEVKALFSNPEVLAENSLNLRMKNEDVGADLNKKCKALMDALQREKLKNEALLIMIGLAEQKFKIKIRKKAGGKQCKPCDKDTQA